jgi:hypothetical protein
MLKWEIVKMLKIELTGVIYNLEILTLILPELVLIRRKRKLVQFQYWLLNLLEVLVTQWEKNKPVLWQLSN